MRNLSLSRLSVGGAAVLALTLAGCTDEPMFAPDTKTDPTPLFSHSADAGPGDHLFVLSAEGAPSVGFLTAVEAAGGTVMRTQGQIGVVSVAGLSDDGAAAVASGGEVEGYNRDPAVQWIPGMDEGALSAMQAPSGQTDQSSAFYYDVGRQWNISQIDADDAWLTTNQGAGATVAILDTGLDPFHIDQVGKIDLANSTSVLTPGSSLCNSILSLPDEETIYDFRFHGAFVGGIVSSNGIAIASVAPDAMLVGVKVLSCTGSGSFDDVIAGIMHAADAGVDVINMSLGAYFDAKPDDKVAKKSAKELIKAIQRAVDYAKKKDVLVVASSGNGGINLDDDGKFIHVPSQLKHVLSVGATGPINQMNFDQLAGYTNYGKSGVDVMAPGGNRTPAGVTDDGIISVCSTFSIFYPVCSLNGFYLVGGNGTSFASPHAAGAAAVYESEKAKNEKGDKLGKCVEKGSVDLGKKGKDELYGKGRINVLAAAACKKPKKKK